MQEAENSQSVRDADDNDIGILRYEIAAFVQRVCRSTELKCREETEPRRGDSSQTGVSTPVTYDGRKQNPAGVTHVGLLSHSPRGSFIGGVLCRGSRPCLWSVTPTGFHL